jgi:hypothetical protein
MSYVSRLRQTLPARHPDYPGSTTDLLPWQSKNKNQPSNEDDASRIRQKLPASHPDYQGSSLNLLPWERESKRNLLKEGTLLEPLESTSVPLDTCVNLDVEGMVGKGRYIKL